MVLLKLDDPQAYFLNLLLDRVTSKIPNGLFDTIDEDEEVNFDIEFYNEIKTVALELFKRREGY